MSSGTKFHLAEKFRQNWQSQYPYLSKNDNRTLQANILKHNNRGIQTSIPECTTQITAVIDDSLTNLNWLQNLNLFSMPPCQAPLSPTPISYFQCSNPQMAPIVSTANYTSRLSHPFFESNSLYAEVAHNLEFMNEEASAHFFKVNNQLRPPFSDINLISMAIYSYNKSKVSFPEICQWIEETFPYYKIINQDWRVGIKNHLTLSKCFQKVPRRKDEIEKGGFWRFSNDFLSYLEKSRLFVKDLSNIVLTAQQENVNQTEYSYGKFLPKKRTARLMSGQDENLNSAFKIPNKKPNLASNDILLGISCFDQIMDRSESGELCGSFLMKSEMNDSIQSNPMVISLNNDIIGDLSLTTATSSSQQLSHFFDRTKVNRNGTFQNAPLILSTDANNGTYPEQITEEEFLTGRLFNHAYLTTQSNVENMPTLLDSQINFNSSEFNIHDLSVTGIGIRAPEWWNQSLTASQLSISKLGCSLRSLASIGNIERGSPFGGDEDHQTVWHTDQNLEELDILFGLS